MDALLAVPLTVALAVVGFVAAAQWYGPADRWARRFSLALFGSYVRRGEPDEREATPNAARRARRLRAAHVETTYRAYAANTLLYAALVAVAGSVIGVYVAAGALHALDVTVDSLDRLPPIAVPVVASLTGEPPSLLAVFGVLLASNATVGVVLGVAVYRLRWGWPGYVARTRERKIDASLERTTAFLYALSRSGMPFHEVMRVLGANRRVYGDAAAEVNVAVREMDLFGTDLLAALRRLSWRTPSDRFGDFAENLVNVLQSGRDVPAFLGEQYEQHHEESESRQSQFVDLLATLAEGYVTVLVAGPLFLITVLVVIGLTLGGTLDFLRATVYLLLPLSTAAFAAYLDSVGETGTVAVRTERHREDARRPRGVRRREDRSTADRPATDGGVAATETEANRARKATFELLRPLRRWVRDPLGGVRDRPTAVLYVTVPLAAVVTAGRLWGGPRTGPPTAAAVDDVVVQAALFLLGTFAAAWALHARHRRAVEAAIPDFLDRLASVNEAGRPVVESFGQVVESDLGALDPELARTWADIQWGARIQEALWRFEERVGTPMATRAVTLVTNAMSASGAIGPVLRIAAREAKAARRLERERRQELFTYVVVIYLSFAVFLTIIVALNTQFLPSVPTVGAAGTGAGAGAAGESLSTSGASGLTQLTPELKRAYRLVLFHAVLVQAVCSGFVAGQMGEGTLKAGAKHATGMLLVAYVALLLG